MDKQKKINRYMRLYLQLEDLLKKSNDETAHMATVSAVLYHKLDYFFWCGFYRLVNGDLIVGPYQGPVACQVLAKNKGVCWAGINKGKTIIVPDVHQFPGHIACDSRSKSEIVVPYRDKTGKITVVLDVDSSELNSFDEVDAEYLEKIIAMI
ncbi:MAG: GAF domain-containing protein [Bacteroidales bacterium]|jgi:GAF domain-containing protein